MHEISEIIELGLYYTYIAAWRTVPVFLVVFLLTSLVRNKIPARIHCLLWLVVLARLLLPISTTSPVAMEAGINDLIGKLSVNRDSVSESGTGVFTFQDESGKTVAVRAPILPIDATADEIEVAEFKTVDAEATSIQVADVPTSKHSVNVVDYYNSSLDWVPSAVGRLMIWGWAIGFTIIACREAFAYLRFALQLQRIQHN